MRAGNATTGSAPSRRCVALGLPQQVECSQLVAVAGYVLSHQLEHVACAVSGQAGKAKEAELLERHSGGAGRRVAARGSGCVSGAATSSLGGTLTSYQRHQQQEEEGEGGAGAGKGNRSCWQASRRSMWNGNVAGYANSEAGAHSAASHERPPPHVPMTTAVAPTLHILLRSRPRCSCSGHNSSRRPVATPSKAPSARAVARGFWLRRHAAGGAPEGGGRPAARSARQRAAAGRVAGDGHRCGSRGAGLPRRCLPVLARACGSGDP